MYASNEKEHKCFKTLKLHRGNRRLLNWPGTVQPKGYFLQLSRKPSKYNGNTDRHLTITALVGPDIIHFIIQIDMLSRGVPALALLSVF